MNYVASTRYVKYASFLIFSAVLLLGSSALAREGVVDCFSVPPGFPFFGYTGEEVECSYADDYCDAFCELCHNLPCAYVTYCEEGVGVGGACDPDPLP